MIRRLLIFLLVVSALGCGGGGTAPSTKPRMLIFRHAEGRVFDELAKGYQAQSYSGKVDRSASLFVIDGANVAPIEISGLEAIDDALRQGVPVLLLHAEEQHKKALLDASELIGASLGGKHDAFLITRRPRGIDILHLGSKRGMKKSIVSRLHNNGILEGQHSDARYNWEPDDAAIGNFVHALNDRVSGRVPSEATRGTDPPSVIPRYIVSVTDAFTSVNNNVVPNQTVTTNVTFFFNVYLSDQGAGNQHQFLIAYAMGLCDGGTPYNLSDRTKGYYQRAINIQMAPNPAENGGLLNVYEQSPFGSTDSYQAGFGAILWYDGGANAYPWSLTIPASPQSIPGWGVSPSNTLDNAPNASGWIFYQNSPYSVVNDDWHDGFSYHSIWVLDYYPKDLNTTSTTQFPINVGSVWQTTSVTTQGIQMQYSVGVNYELLNADEDSPGIYTRERTQQNLAPDPTSITLLFGRAS